MEGHLTGCMRRFGSADLAANLMSDFSKAPQPNTVPNAFHKHRHLPHPLQHSATSHLASQATNTHPSYLLAPCNNRTNHHYLRCQYAYPVAPPCARSTRPTRKPMIEPWEKVSA
ncbi:hypothetical protein IG631_02600 [Alternaria alternata]|nr:hypothetical protein IG631_02600 [Alternaria alternata]